MTTNSKILQKADWVIGDLTPTTGLLSPEQANIFIRKLLIQPTILRQARAVTMSAPTRKINKIQFASRILKPGVSGTALSVGDRSKVTTEQIELNTKEVIAEIRLPYDVIEDNIERGNIGMATDTGGTPTTGGIKDTIMTLIAERAALDLEELSLHGDTLSGDPYLALVDGYLKLATSNVVDNSLAGANRAMFSAGLKAMPDQYLRSRASMRNWLSVNNEIDYREALGNRETSLGDAQIQGTAPVFGAGVPVESAAILNNSTGLMTNPLNMLFGIQRQIHIETAKDITARVYIIVLTARVDFQLEEELAVVKYTNIV